MQLIPNEFQEYSFDSGELQAIYSEVSAGFTYLLHTRRAELCRERLALEVDPEKTIQFIQTEAALKSAIHEITALLTSIEAAKTNTYP